MQQRSEKSQIFEKLDSSSGRNVNAFGKDLAVSAVSVRNETDPLPSELMERICESSNLNIAFKRVKSNKGSAGVDGMTIDQLSSWIQTNKTAFIKSLLDGSYIPQPVRKVEIPKPDGGKRMLGIPTVVDRLVQQAILQILQPIFEEEFSASSFGFRPKRSAHDAIKQAHEYVKSGKKYVVDIDLEKFFDRVNHDMLMARVARRVGDKRLLKIIRRFLEAGIMDTGVVVSRDEGTPQGGPLSPLLSNIILGDLDKELEKRGHAFCRYADDCNIYVRSKAAAERCLASIACWIERRLKLKVNREKSAAAYSGRRKFLGHRVERHQISVSEQSLSRLKGKLRTMTHRRQSKSLEACIGELNHVIRGWTYYHRMCSCKGRLESLDEWLRHRLRSIKLHQLKRAYTRVNFLTSLGIKPADAWNTCKSGKGIWRLSNTPAAKMGMSKNWFTQQELLSFSEVYAKVRS